MGCYKKTKNGDLINWPCGKEKDGHIFAQGVKKKSDKENLEIEKYKEWLKKNNLKDSHKNRENFN